MMPFCVLIGLYMCCQSAISCNSFSKNDEGKADIRGKIIKITHSLKEVKEHNKLGTITIEGIEPNRKEIIAVITISAETLIFKQVGNSKQRLGYKDLKESLLVDVFVHGPILMSFPVQGEAQEILILAQPQEERR
ncbi:MAG: hypothetical protein HUU08_17425 [Candidatus Brocadia sp.]|nr:hypothetical protein [Candidatus Brocadia sp.]